MTWPCNGHVTDLVECVPSLPQQVTQHCTQQETLATEQLFVAMSLAFMVHKASQVMLTHTVCSYVHWQTAWHYMQTNCLRCADRSRRGTVLVDWMHQLIAAADSTVTSGWCSAVKCYVG